MLSDCGMLPAMDYRNPSNRICMWYRKHVHVIRHGMGGALPKHAHEEIDRWKMEDGGWRMEDGW